MKSEPSGTRTGTPFAAPRRSRSTRTLAGTLLLGWLVSGCAAYQEPGASAVPEPSARSVPASEGPCHELTLGRLRFDTGDAHRVVFATADERRATRVTLTGCVQVEGGYAEEWTAPGRIGAGGFGPVDSTKVNSLQTPSGSYTMTEGFGREDPGTDLEYHELIPSSRWGGREGPYFNEYFEGPGAAPDENLWRLMNEGLYEQAVVINYNRPPDAVARYGLSFAIFLHAGLAESWGCISTDVGTVTRVLQHATPGDRIVMGAVGDVFRA